MSSRAELSEEQTKRSREISVTKPGEIYPRLQCLAVAGRHFSHSPIVEFDSVEMTYFFLFVILGQVSVLRHADPGIS